MSNYLKYTIVYNDTLQSISQDKLNDPERWVEIAILNNLVYPFITNNKEDKKTGVLTIGDEIIIPIAPEQLENLTKSQVLNIYNKYLGQDLDVFGTDNVITLTENEICETNSDVYGDLLTVNGLKNFKQALLMRLATPEGSLLGHPNYGSRLFLLLGIKGTSESLQKIKIELERVIRSDGRTKDITFEFIKLENEVVSAKIKIELIGVSTIVSFYFSLDKGGIVEWA